LEAHYAVILSAAQRSRRILWSLLKASITRLPVLSLESLDCAFGSAQHEIAFVLRESLGNLRCRIS
jgi:hypothetical protein